MSNEALANVNPRVISMWEHNGWGDSIHFMNDALPRRVTGHMRRVINEGDN